MKRLQSTCVALLEFGEVTILEESQLEVGKLKNGKAAGKYEISGEMIKGVGDRVVNWI